MNSSWLRELVKHLVAVNTGLPVILDTIALVTASIRLATGGGGVSTIEAAQIIREEIAAGKSYGQAEIARMDALIAAQAGQ